MSHQPERIEKDCLNCGTITIGLYCHVCGQENIVTKQGALALTRHFIYDVFHFDGKFFDTLRMLLAKPGVVAKEYVSGKRNKYLDPIRIYLLSGWGVFTFLMGVLQILWFFYLYKSMRNFYGQARGKTIVKFLVVNFCAFIVMLMLFLGFLMFSIFQI